METRTKVLIPRLRPRPKLQDEDQDRGRSETGLVIRPRSQTPRLDSSFRTDATATPEPLYAVALKSRIRAPLFRVRFMRVAIELVAIDRRWSVSRAGWSVIS